MKKISLLSLLALVTTLLFSSCTKDSCTTTTTYFKYEPIYKTVDEIRQPIAIEAVRDLKKPGKIYMYHNYLLINEQFEGIHVIDNSNPASPNKVAFIKIEGNIDMAMKGNILYADSYIDLVTIDMTNVLSPVLVDRDEAVFPDYGTRSMATTYIQLITVICIRLILTIYTIQKKDLYKILVGQILKLFFLIKIHYSLEVTKECLFMM